MDVRKRTGSKDPARRIDGIAVIPTSAVDAFRKRRLPTVLDMNTLLT
jgi:hypothetical protein